jgi:hypothetical protein
MVINTNSGVTQFQTYSEAIALKLPAITPTVETPETTSFSFYNISIKVSILIATIMTFVLN